MKSHELAILAVLGGLVITLLLVWLEPADINEGVDIQAEMKDPLLTGSIAVAQHGTYGGARIGEAGQFIVRYSTTYGDGTTPRLVKTILAARMPYQTRCGHFVVYEHFRPDGTLMSDRLVHPEPELGGGVMVKWRDRSFAPSGEQIEERYTRQNGTVGVIVDVRTGHFKQFQNDGVSLRYEQFNHNEGTVQIWYKKDGKTIWYERGTDNVMHVHFDLYGNPISKRFSSESASTTFTMSSGEQAKMRSYDNYTRPDGTLEYRQSWYMLYNAKKDNFIEAVGSVTLYDASGTRPLVEYKLELRPQVEPRFINEVVVYNTDGTKLLRKYRAIGQRLSEELLDARGKVLSHRDFDASDRYFEQVDDVVFQGFGHDLWLSYDDDKHMID